MDVVSLCSRYEIDTSSLDDIFYGHLREKDSWEKVVDIMEYAYNWNRDELYQKCLRHCVKVMDQEKKYIPDPFSKAMAKIKTPQIGLDLRQWQT